MNFEHLSFQIVILKNLIIELLLEACDFLLKFFNCENFLFETSFELLELVVFALKSFTEFSDFFSIGIIWSETRIHLISETTDFHISVC